MTVSIFGGTFNPVHHGHLRAAEEVREQLGLDSVLLTPVNRPALKDLDGAVSGEHRLKMLELACNSNPHFKVLDCEIRRGGTSYSLHTIEYVWAEYGERPTFILGQDAFDAIASWYEWRRLFELADFAVMTRPGSAPNLPVAVDFASEIEPGKYRTDSQTTISFVTVTALAISSSQIRANLRAGRSIRYLVPEAVADYIKQERIYI
jgi:nicotinate-nucleotide adenylyltransferase